MVHEQVGKLEEQAQSELDRLKLQKDKLEREQHKLLQAHYADAIPLHLLKEEQERIGKSLKNINSSIKAYQMEYTKTTTNINSVFELLDDCGTTYRLAGDFERRCFNQAIFKMIRVHEDLTLDVEYTEPFETLLSPSVFALKSEFEKYFQSTKEEQPDSTAPLSLMQLLSIIKTQTCKKINNFFGASLSTDYLVREAGLEPARP